MKNLLTYTVTMNIILTAALVLTGCGKNPELEQPNHLAPVGEIDEDGVVIKSRAVLAIQSNEDSTLARMISPFLLASAWAASSGSKGIQVTNGANTQMTMSDTLWVQPSITNAVLDFGSLSVSNLVDNNLKVCGVGGAQKCTHAFIRVYTTGVAGDGLWNATDSYGAPINVTRTGAVEAGTVGLGAGNSVTVQSVAIAGNKNVLRLADFSGSSNYQFQIDFSNAGKGDYETTLVVEYGLIKQ